MSRIAGAVAPLRRDLPIMAVTSTMRLEKPHSLSYQDRTLTKLPSMTLVSRRSTIDDTGEPLKSIETSASSRTGEDALERPRRGGAQGIVDLLLASAVCFSSATRSTIETFEVGTRIAMPSSLPLSSGSTSPTARAAPVVVGIIDSAAARARRRSLCGRSRMCWSFV